jgi:hypothetical protein
MTNPNGTAIESALGHVWAGDLELSALNSAMTLNPRNATRLIEPGGRFWATPTRPGDSTVKEVMQITLASPRLVNYVTFSAAIFPQDIALEFYDDRSSSWKPALEAPEGAPSPAVCTILDSQPGVLPPSSSIRGHLHPQHSFSGHWRNIEFRIRPLVVTKLRLVLRRNPAGRLPTNSFGRPKDYSLAIRSFVTGYKVESRADVPRTEPRPGSTSEYESFATMTDVLGSTVDFSLRVNRASNVLREQGPNPADATLVWKSEPQPIPWAVVSLYMDLRARDGSAQVIDRIYVDPLYEGPNLNVYWSDTEPSGMFRAVDDQLDFGVVTVHDERGVTGNVLHAGATNKDYIGYVDVDNAPFGFAPSRTWWVGGKLNFKFPHGTQNYISPVLDFGEFDVSLTPTTFRVQTTHGDTLNIGVVAFDPATDVTFFVGHGDDDVLSMWLRVGDAYYSASMTLSVPFTRLQPPMLRVGGRLGTFPGTANSDIDSLVLKVDEDFDEATALDFLRDPAPFVFTGREDSRTDNALLRYDTSFVTAQFRSGFYGGVIDRFDEISWNPVARDFVLRKGFLYLPPTKAKYFKLEFCGLVPEPIEIYKPVSRTVKTYPVVMWNGPTISSTLWDVINVTRPGMMSSINLGISRNYRDSTGKIGTGGNGKQFSDTSARVLWDADSRINVGTAYWAWNFLPLHKPPITPSFEVVGTHTYETTVVEHKTKMGYFVGLKALSAYRLDYASAEDVPQVIELFHDTSNLDEATNWTLPEDHVFTSGQALYAVARSKVVPSRRVVRALQFATQQSVAKQLLPDDDFTDPTFANWSTVGDAHLDSTLTLDEVVGTTLRIDRSVARRKWADVEETFPLWSNINGTRYDVLELGTTLGSNFGGVSSVAVDAPIGGRVYAAARVIAHQDLAQPLKIQIIDDNTGAVVAEAQTDVKAHKVTEWYCGFNLGDIVENEPFLWSDFSATTTGGIYVDTFQRDNANFLSSMTSGQRWYDTDRFGNPISLHVVGSRAKATTEDQTNWFVADSLWGTLEFSGGTVGTTTVGERMLVEFAPLYLDDDGEVHYSGGMGLSYGGVLTTDGSPRGVLANDKIKIEILPTVALPPGRAPLEALDPVIHPYAIMFSLNGVWKRTICHSFGVRSLRSIKGRVDQEFKSYSWTPKSYGRLQGKAIYEKPSASYGAWLDSGQTKFLDADGNTWFSSGTWDISANTRELTGYDNCGYALRATANGSVLATDTDVWYGTLHAYIRNIADTESGAALTGARHGNILCLDYARGIFVNFAGDIVDAVGTNYGSLFPGGFADNTRISVMFARTARLQVGSRGGHSPTTAPDMLIAKVNGTVVGRYVGTWLQQWRGTIRGVAGDALNGTVGALPQYDVHTTFRAVGWAPDASNMPVVPNEPTWDNVSNYGLNTYDSMTDNRSAMVRPRLRAQVVQSGESTDAWEIDTLSMYYDPIVWSFSNDGGVTWYRALDIRNNPNGVLAFPPSLVVTNPDQKPGQSLVWKVESYAPGATVSSLVIRPWYGGTLSGITHHVGVAGGGPNAMPYDHYSDIRKDSRFQTWNSPIPQDWWHAYRILRRAQLDTDAGRANISIYPADDLFPADNLYPASI